MGAYVFMGPLPCPSERENGGEMGSVSSFPVSARETFSRLSFSCIIRALDLTKKGGNWGPCAFFATSQSYRLDRSDEAKIDPILPICERGGKVQKIMEGPRRELI